MNSLNIPEGLSKEVIDAIRVFTDDEVRSIRAIYLYETREFIGIEMADKEILYKPTDPVKYNALKVIEDAYRKEMYSL